MSMAGDFVLPPPPSVPPTLPESKVEAKEHQPKCYKWKGQLREWVSVPPISLDATPKHEMAYLLHSKIRALAEEHTQAEV
ncbi:hypothetical protein D1007_25521 [Hordeum vulgare]|nr:hypothetical protein D1007_25521 [Hordeum vulgare]